MVGLTPFILTENPSTIQIKKWLAFAILMVTLFAISMKIWIYC